MLTEITIPCRFSIRVLRGGGSCSLPLCKHVLGALLVDAADSFASAEDSSSSADEDEEVTWPVPPLVPVSARRTETEKAFVETVTEAFARPNRKG